ncbi:MAG: NUDIX hydrolase [Patescibacteria group bacterium]
MKNNKPVPGVDYVGISVGVHCLNSKGEILLTKRSIKARDEHGAWDKIGGGTKHNEKLEDAARREVLEETGCEAKNLTFLGFEEVFREHQGKKTHWICMIYKCEIDHAKVCVNIPEADDFGWFSLDNLPTPLTSQFHKQLVHLLRYNSSK